jgi:hypothetical protein
MPRVGAPQLLGRALMTPVTVCAYLSWSALIVELDHLPGKLGVNYVRMVSS